MRSGNTRMIGLTLSLVLFGATATAAQQDRGAALRAAASTGDADAVRALLADGVAVDAANEYGATALMLASFRGHEDIVRVLVEAGADVELADRFYGRSSLAWAAANDHQNIVALLFTSDVEGFHDTFNAAVQAGDLARVAELLALHVPEIDVLSAALQHAIDSQNRELGELLFNHGAVPPPPEIVTVEPEILRVYEGVYVDEVGFELEVRRDPEAGGLLVRPSGLRNALRFLPIEPTAFISEQSDAIFIRFTMRDGQVVFMTFAQPGDSRRMTKR